MLFLHTFLFLKDGDGMANSVDPDQVASSGIRSSLIWVYNIARKLRIITLLFQKEEKKSQKALYM